MPFNQGSRLIVKLGASRGCAVHFKLLHVFHGVPNWPQSACGAASSACEVAPSITGSQLWDTAQFVGTLTGFDTPNVCGHGKRAYGFNAMAALLSIGARSPSIQARGNGATMW